MSAQTLLALRGLADHLAVVIADMERVALPGGDTPAEGSGGDAMEGVPAHQAQGGDVPSPAGTSSGGDGAHRSPPAPSDQPTPQAGDVWASRIDSRRVRIKGAVTRQWRTEVVRGSHGTPREGSTVVLDIGRMWSLIERDGRPWPPAQEPESTPSDGVVTIARCPEHGLHGCRTECFVCGGPVEQVSMVPLGDAPSQEPGPAEEQEPATDERPEVVPADDDDLAVVEGTNVPVRHQFDWNNWFVACLAARARQEQADAARQEGFKVAARERERDAQARAELAETERDETREALDVAREEIQRLRAEVEAARPVGKETR